jgi:putative transposase
MDSVPRLCREDVISASGTSVERVARPPRTQTPGGVYHVTARGNRRQEIFIDDSDRWRMLELLTAVCEQSKWQIHAYCLMPNHYHLVVEIVEPTLSDGFQRLNSVYAQGFNRRHLKTGHLFQGRFHSVAVESEGHLLELSRYLVRNPVRARLCSEPADWPWSNYRAMLGITAPARFLAIERVLTYFGQDPDSARRRFRSFVRDARP